MGGPAAGLLPGIHAELLHAAISALPASHSFYVLGAFGPAEVTDPGCHLSLPFRFP